MCVERLSSEPPASDLLQVNHFIPSAPFPHEDTAEGGQMALAVGP